MVGCGGAGGPEAALCFLGCFLGCGVGGLVAVWGFGGGGVDVSVVDEGLGDVGSV